MKRHLVLLSAILLLITSCSLTVDEPKAKQLIENLLNDLKSENFSELDKYYISSFNESEPVDKKIEKYNRLKEVIGPIESYQFVSATEKYDDYSNIKFLELLYSVKGKKLTVKETFRLMNDAGDLKITYQNIENMK
ncbi:MAG TPA: hypothetical protein VJY62_04590 [Bacteroidia bacterium]|nr:hypothetical protein [Bacteroidia bacterium]